MVFGISKGALLGRFLEMLNVFEKKSIFPSNVFFFVFSSRGKAFLNLKGAHFGWFLYNEFFSLFDERF